MNQFLHEPSDLPTAIERLNSIKGQQALLQGLVFRVVKVRCLFRQLAQNFEKWVEIAIKENTCWGIRSLETALRYARAGHIVWYLGMRKQFNLEEICAKVGSPYALQELLPSTFSSKNSWPDGTDMRIPEKDRKLLLEVMNSTSDVPTYVRAKKAVKQPTHALPPVQQQQQQQPPNATVEPEPVDVDQHTVLQQQPQQRQLQQEERLVTRRQQRQTPSNQGKQAAAEQQLSPCGDTAKQCKSPAGKVSSKPAPKAASRAISRQGVPVVIPRPVGVPYADPRTWQRVAEVAVAVEHRELVYKHTPFQTCSSSSSSSSTASSSSAAAAEAQHHPAPCHNIIAAPSGMELHIIVTAPISSFEEYAAAQQGALSEGSQHRTVVLVPVTRCTRLGGYLLHVAGSTDLAPSPQVLVVSQHNFTGGNSTTGDHPDRLFCLELQNKVHDSLTEAEPVALSCPGLSGFVHLQGPTVLVTIPEGCSRPGEISTDHVAASVHPTPSIGFTDEQMEAFCRAALPACSTLLALRGCYPKKLAEGRCEVLSELCRSAGQVPKPNFDAVLRLVLTVLMECAPFTRGLIRQTQTRGTSGDFFSDGLRASGGGGPGTTDRGWHIGKAEWYHDVGSKYSTLTDAEQQAAYLAEVKEGQQAWRGCRAALISLLYAYLRSMLGPVLLAFQTSISMQPGMEDVRLQADVPYQQMQSSLNAHVGVHRDWSDLQGTTIIWLSPAACAPPKPSSGSRKRCAPEPSSPGAAFVLYDLGCVFEVGHLSHLWVRSDRYWHGTIRDHVLPEQDGILFGTAFANKKDVTEQVLQAWNQGKDVTWRRMYDADAAENIKVKAPKAKAATAEEAAEQQAADDVADPGP